MKRPYNFRPRADWAKLAVRIEKLARREPQLPPAAIAERLECSHVTVRKVLRAAGLYVERGAHGKVLE